MTTANPNPSNESNTPTTILESVYGGNMSIEDGAKAVSELLKQERLDTLQMIYHEGTGELAELAARHISGELKGERSYVSMPQEVYDENLKQEYWQGFHNGLVEGQVFDVNGQEKEPDEDLLEQEYQRGQTDLVARVDKADKKIWREDNCGHDVVFAELEKENKDGQ